MVSEVRRGVLAMAATALAAVWVTIVHDDGQAAGQFMIVLAAAMAAFATGLDRHAMTRAAIGLAGMEVALGLLIATAPITAGQPGGAVSAILFHAALAAGWLIAAALFARRTKVTA